MISNRLQHNSDQALIQKKLREIKHLAQESYISVKEIIWHTDAEEIRFSDLFEQIQRTARSILTDCKISYHFPNEFENHIVPIKIRRNVILLIKESLYNCAKYAKANTMLIRAEFQSNLLKISLADDGCGFDSSCGKTADSESGRGLANMERRAKLLGAELTIDSLLEKGTEITLKMPIQSP